MRIVRMLALVVLSGVGTVAPAWAQYPICTWEWDKTNASWHHGTYLWLKYTVTTFHNSALPPCQIGFFVEGSVDGVSGSALRGDGLLSAIATKEVPVPSSGTYRTSGKHSRGSVFGELQLGTSMSEAEVNYQGPPPYDCATDPGLPECSPLLIDVLGNGFQFTNAERGVAFDITGDGNARQISWTRADSDDAWLVHDPNGNGKPGENGLEMFGNFTQVYADSEATASNGFEALKFFEGLTYAPATPDQVIDANDSIWAKLSLWADRNHDGQATADELQPVSAVLKSISLAYEVGKRHKQGNYMLQVSTATRVDGTLVTIADVWVTGQK